jgi:hypothetical protein
VRKSIREFARLELGAGPWGGKSPQVHSRSRLKDKEKWMELCEKASTEQDPEKLLVLVAEIERLLHEKENRLKEGSLRNSE